MINKIILNSVLIIFFASCILLSQEKINKQESGTDEELWTTFFVNSMTGWCVGGTNNQGVIIKTTNGGDNWSSQFLDLSNFFYSCYFLNDMIGWICGSNGLILKTTNGGDNWKQQTTNYDKDLWTITFIDEKTGFCSGSGGWILKTSDGGNSWLKIKTEANLISKLFFINKNIGWAAANLYPKHGLILRTTNGGEKWDTQLLEYSKIIESIYFLNSKTGWCVGSEGYITKTTNSGVNWHKSKNNYYSTFMDLFFQDSCNGWVCSGLKTKDNSIGEILRTSDGGITFGTTYSEKRFNSIYYDGSKYVFFAGDSGMLYRVNKEFKNNMVYNNIYNKIFESDGVTQKAFDIKPIFEFIDMTEDTSALYSIINIPSKNQENKTIIHPDIYLMISKYYNSTWKLGLKIKIFNQESFYCEFIQKPEIVFIDKTKYLFLFYSLCPMGNASNETDIFFTLLDLNNFYFNQLLFTGKPEYTNSDGIKYYKGNYYNYDNFTKNETIKKYLQGKAKQSNLLLPLNSNLYDIDDNYNFEDKWQRDNPVLNEIQKINYNLSNEKINITYYDLNPMDLFSASCLQKLDNKDFLIYNYYRGSVIGFDKNSKKYFPIIAESCNHGCDKEIKLLRNNKLEIKYIFTRNYFIIDLENMSYIYRLEN